MHNKTVYILWDAAYIWGLMAWRAIKSFGLPYVVAKSIKINQGALLGKPNSGLLLVPGGSARRKAESLGANGRKLIKDWVGAGGAYLGFCGGAGFALAHDLASLGICTWKRAPYAKRIYHFLSGNVNALREDGRLLQLPVWWPGRFSPESLNGIKILASYDSPCADLCIADLPAAKIPAQVLEDLDKKYNQQSTLDFPAGQPLVINGNYGLGQYILSYAHLETPVSQDANYWLCGLLDEFFGFKLRPGLVPLWQTYVEDAIKMALDEKDSLGLCMEKAYLSMSCLMNLGKELGLFFKRTPWLMGWHSGAPGMMCNHLLAALQTMAEIGPGPQAIKFWQIKKNVFCDLFNVFCQRSEKFFWQWRIAKTLDSPPAASAQELFMEQTELFGQPMSGGGLIQILLDIMDDLVFLSIKNNLA